MGADEEGEAESTGQGASNDEWCSLLCLIGVVASKDSGDSGQNVRRNRKELSASGGVSEICDESTADLVSVCFIRYQRADLRAEEGEGVDRSQDEMEDESHDPVLPRELERSDVSLLTGYDRSRQYIRRHP